jgi:membrane protein implicated in regulation of membrane protease activity
MPSEFPTNELQNAWQNQPTEALKMSADKLRRQAQERDRKARRAVLISAAIAIVLFLWFGWGFLSFQRIQTFGLGPWGLWSARLGLAMLSLWSLYSGYRTYKVFWPSAAASEADLKTTLQSYRQQLEKRRDYSQNIWLRSGLIFCFAGMAMVVGPMLVRDIQTPLRMLERVGPIFALLILWLAIFIPQRKRRQRKLQQEIDQLRRLESEYQV